MRSLSRSSILGAVVGAALSAAPARAWTEREIAVPADPGSAAVLVGTLTLPDGDGRVPGALIIPGSGPTDRDGNSQAGGRLAANDKFKILARELAERGIASLRIDKRGIGGSRGAVMSEEELTFDRNITDALAWLDALARERRIERLFIIGHSEGATVATLTALRRPLGGIALLAGPSEKAGDGLKRQLRAQGAPAPILAEIDRMVALIERGERIRDVPRELLALFRPSVQPYLISWFRIDPVAALAAVTAPVLVVQGTNDLQVTVADAERLAAARHVAPVIVAGMNHPLKRVPDGNVEANIAAYSDPTLPLAPGLVDALAGFIADPR